MPRVYFGKRVLFATSHSQPQWRPAICLTQADDPTGIDLVFVQQLSNGQCKWHFRDACRHIADPASKDPNYLQNIEQDNEGGLWKEDEESAEIARLRDELAKLKAMIIEYLGGETKPPAPAPAKKPHWTQKKKQKAAEETVPVPTAALVTEPDLDLIGNPF